VLAGHLLGDIVTSLRVVVALVTQPCAIGGQESAKVDDLCAFVGGQSAILTEECATGAATCAVVGEACAKVAKPRVFFVQPLANLVERCARHCQRGRRVAAECFSVAGEVR
jgi:hypothetical protein